MKVAFLFLTNENHHQGVIWEKFFQDQYREFYSIYCHPKYQNLVTQTFLKDHIIPEQIDTKHADISIVRATILLLKNAVKDTENEYFILLSESCVPLYRFEQIYNTLKLNHKSYISYIYDQQNEETKMRWSQLQDHEFVTIDNFLKQHQWMILHRDVVNIILNYDYTHVFEQVYAPDEHYFINLLINKKFSLKDKVINQMATFVNWQDYEIETGIAEDDKKGKYRFQKIRPKTYYHLSMQNVLDAQSQGCLFLRKVSPQCDCTSIEIANILSSGVESGNPTELLSVLQEALKIDSSPQAIANLFTWLTQDDVATLREEIINKLLLTPNKIVQF